MTELLLTGFCIIGVSYQSSFGIEENIFDSGIVIVPDKTGGAKYTMMLKNNPEIYKIDINEDLGRELIEGALNNPSEIAWNIAKIIWEDIGDYIPPEPETPPE